jgi:hypothetical protein
VLDQEWKQYYNAGFNPEAKQNRFALADQRNRGRAAGCTASSAERVIELQGN